MSYEKGQLRFSVGYKEDKDYEEYELPQVELPHSCDSWIIGGIKEIDALIEDLKKAKSKIKEE